MMKYLAGRKHEYVCVHLHSCSHIVLRGNGRLRSLISYILATKQMNAEAVSDVDPKY